MYPEYTHNRLRKIFQLNGMLRFLVNILINYRKYGTPETELIYVEWIYGWGPFAFFGFRMKQLIRASVPKIAYSVSRNVSWQNFICSHFGKCFEKQLISTIDSNGHFASMGHLLIKYGG